MSTKGSWQRPVNKKVFDENYDLIFKKQKSQGDNEKTESESKAATIRRKS